MSLPIHIWIWIMFAQDSPTWGRCRPQTANVRPIWCTCILPELGRHRPDSTQSGPESANSGPGLWDGPCLVPPIGMPSRSRASARRNRIRRASEAGRPPVHVSPLLGVHAVLRPRCSSLHARLAALRASVAPRAGQDRSSDCLRSKSHTSSWADAKQCVCRCAQDIRLG